MRLSTLRYQRGLFGRCGAALKLPRRSGIMAPPEGWGENNERGWLECELEFKDFMAAMKFVNQVAEIAEDLSRHPDT